MSSNNDTVTPSPASEHLTGRVKWFNNKAGYGFINVTDGARSGTDVFIHHSAINVDSQQYKYLVQGEYVEFELNLGPCVTFNCSGEAKRISREVVEALRIKKAKQIFQRKRWFLRYQSFGGPT